MDWRGISTRSISQIQCSRNILLESWNFLHLPFCWQLLIGIIQFDTNALWLVSHMKHIAAIFARIEGQRVKQNKKSAQVFFFFGFEKFSILSVSPPLRWPRNENPSFDVVWDRRVFLHYAVWHVYFQAYGDASLTRISARVPSTP